MSYLIGGIENAIIERIKQAQSQKALGYTLKKIGTYGGELAESVERAVMSFPAVLCIYNGDNLDTNRSTEMQDMRVYNFVLFCCAKSLRNEAAGRKGAGDKVGSYQIADDMRNLFREHKFDGLDSWPVRVLSVRPVMNDKPSQQLVSVYAVDLQVTVSVDYEPDTSGLHPFNIFHANWDIPPFNEDIQSPLPADDKADATDHIVLPQEE